MSLIAFTGGGTGGHIYPGLAIIDELITAHSTLSFLWIGSSKKDKQKIISYFSHSTPLSFVAIPSGKLRRYFSLQNFIDFFKIFFGILSALFLFIKKRPVLLFSKGGFVSVPPCVAAKILKIPVITHECDFSPGLATKLNSIFADYIILSYEESRKFFSQKIQKKIRVLGNPVRKDFYTAQKTKGFNFLHLEPPLKKPLLLVLGGSAGARQINNIIFNNIQFFIQHFIVVHQTGQSDDYKQAQILCQQYTPHYLAFDYIYADMPHVLASADYVLSRSGANAVWETATLQKPMLLLPLAGSGTRGDQIENATWFQNQGIAYVLDSTKTDNELFHDLKKGLETMQTPSYHQKIITAYTQLAKKEKPSKLIANFIYNEVHTCHLTH